MAAAQRPSLAPRAGALCAPTAKYARFGTSAVETLCSVRGAQPGPSLAVARGCARAVVAPLTPRTGIVRVSAALRLPDAPLPDCPHCPARPPRGSDVCSCRSRTAHGVAQSPPLEPSFTWRPLLRLPSVQALRSLGLTQCVALAATVATTTEQGTVRSRDHEWRRRRRHTDCRHR